MASRNNPATKKRKTSPPLGGGLDDNNNNAVDGPTGADADPSVKRARGGSAGGGGSGTSAPSSSVANTTNNSAVGVDKQFYDNKLAEFEEELRLIKSGDHPDFSDKIKQFEKKKKEDLQKASLLRELRRKEAETIHDFQVQEANDVCASRKKELQERMVLDAEEAIKRMKELRDGAARKKGGRGRTGSIGGPDEDESQGEDDSMGGGGTSQGDEQEETAASTSIQQPQQKKSARMAASLEKKTTTTITTDANVGFAAPPDVIAQDLAAVHADWMKRVGMYHSKDEVANLAVRIEDGRLYFNEHVIERGNSVVIHSEPSNEEFYGVVAKIAANDGVWVKLADSTNTKLSLSHMRLGRVKIAKEASREQTGMSSQ